MKNAKYIPAGATHVRPECEEWEESYLKLDGREWRIWFDYAWQYIEYCDFPIHQAVRIEPTNLKIRGEVNGVFVEL